jgi:hypothetical protein
MNSLSLPDVMSIRRSGEYEVGRHKEVSVKVNALADEGVAELVAALSEIDGLITLESCQGGDGKDAFVQFRFGTWKDSGRLLFDYLLPSMSADLRSMVSVRIQAYDADTATASIAVEPSAVPLLSECVRRLDAATVSARVLVARDAHRKAVA